MPHPQPLLRSSRVITNSFNRSILKTIAIHLNKLKVEMSVNILRILLLSTHVFAPPCLVISCTRILRGPSKHTSGTFNSKYHSISKSKARNSAAPRTPSITSPEPLPKHSKIENPSRAMAVVAGRVHLGPGRDQLLDHSAVTSPSRPMQRRLALAAGMRHGRRGSCSTEEKQSVAMGCWSGWLSKNIKIVDRLRLQIFQADALA